MPKAKKHTYKFTLHKNKLVLLIALVIVAVFGYKLAVSYMAEPAGINELTATVSKNPAPTRVGMPRPTGGDTCYYMDVQCVQAPCNPVLVCPNPSSTPVPSAPVYTPYPLPSLVSTPMPQPSINPTLSGVASFVSKGSCGSNHFLTISFSCMDGRMEEVSNNVCTDVFSAFKLAYTSCVSTGIGGYAK